MIAIVILMMANYNNEVRGEIIRIGGNVVDDENYCIYLRKSREDIEVEKYDGVDTLDRHRKTLVGFAKEHNLKIGHIYEEVVSGETIEDRPKMQELIRDVEDNKWNGVLVMEVQRLARGDTADQGVVSKTFKYSETKIVTPTKTYDPNNDEDEEYFEFGLFMSRREYKTTNRRLQRGRLTSVSEGKFVASSPSIGYKKKKLEHSKGFTLELEPQEVEIVKQIFNLYAYQDEKIENIARILNDLGVKPRKANEWSSSSIKDILDNPVYIGKIRWGARKQKIIMKNGKRIKTRPRSTDVIIKDGLHEPIIDDETWRIVQAKRKLNSPPVVHNNIVQNPLSGIVYCEKCGKTMQRRPYTSKLKIPTLMCNNKNCDNISSKLYLVEDKIIEALKIWLKSFTIDYDEIVKMQKKSKVVTDKELLKQLKVKLDKEKDKQNKIYDLFEEGIYDKNAFTERLDNVKSNIKDLEERIKPIADRVQEQENIIAEKKVIIPKIENVIDIYYKLETSEQKNELLKTILKKVTYLKTTKAIKKDSDPTDFEIHIYPKIPKI